MNIVININAIRNCIYVRAMDVIPTQSVQLNQMNQMNQNDQMNRLPPEFLMPVPFCELMCDYCCWAFCECGICFLCDDD